MVILKNITAEIEKKLNEVQVENKELMDRVRKLHKENHLLEMEVKTTLECRRLKDHLQSASKGMLDHADVSLLDLDLPPMPISSENKPPPQRDGPSVKELC